MARQYKTGLIITGDASGGVKAIQATEKELKQLNRGFERGSKRAKRFGKDAGETSRELEFLRNTATGVGAAIAGAFAVSNLAGQARMVAETDALAKSLSASTTELLAWQYAGERVGIQGDKMGDIFKDASEKIGDFARTEGGEAADLIEQMGLNIQELLRLSPDQQLLKIGEALQVLSPSERTTFLESLGDDAVRLQPLLENNAAALREYVDEAERLGVAMDQADIDAVVQADRAMQQLTATGQGLSNQLLADLGPGFASFTGELVDFIQQAGGAEEVLGEIGDAATLLATVYLARRLGPGLLSAGAKGLTMGRNIAAGLVMATGATGPLNRALVVTQGRIAATAAAGRAMSASLALIGGPAGAAVLAASALVIYHDELDDMLAPTERATQRIDDLTNAINLNSEAAVKGQLVNITAQMVEVERQARETEQALSEVNDRYNTPGPFRQSLVQGAGAEERRPLLEERQRLSEEQQALSASADQLRDRLQMLGEQGAAPTASSLSTLTTSTDAAAEAAREAAEREDQFARSLATLEDRLFPATAAQRDFRQDQILLQTALMKGEISIDRYLEAWGRLQQSALSDENWQDAYNFTGQAANGVDQISDAARDLGFTFESAFESAVIEGEGLREVLSGIAEDIARIALRESVTKPVAGTLSSAIGGMFGGGSVSGPGDYNTSAGGFLGSVGFGGGRRTGGSVEPGKLYEINENGAPEVLRQGGRQYLLPGTEPGRVIPASGPGALPASGGSSDATATGGNITLAPVIHVHAQQGVSDEDARRQGAKAAEGFLDSRIVRVIMKEQRPGGILHKTKSR